MKEAFLLMLSMGGYGAYIWSAYGLVCGVFLLNGWSLRRQRALVRKTLGNHHASHP